MTFADFLPHLPGEVRRVSSTANEAIKAIRSLELKKNRLASGLFIAEGARTVIEALELGAGLKAIVHLEAVREEPHVRRIADGVIAKGGLVIEVSPMVLEKISHRENPQTVIGVFEQRLGSLETIGTAPRILALEHIRDPGNLGTILRTADGLGCRDVLLVGDCTDPFALDAVRASMGSLFAVNIVAVTFEAFMAWRKTYPGLVAGTHLAGAVDIRTVAWRDPALIVMGNEQKGLTPAMAAACDVLVKIPMAGRADSLNLAIATGITLFESIRGR